MSYRIIKRDKGRQTIRLDYHGGAYIDMTFGHQGCQPTEVINVWDYETCKPDAPFDRFDDMSGAELTAALKLTLEGWVRSNEEEGWPDWYQGYLENARYS